MADLEEAIRVGRKAVNTTSENHPERARWVQILEVRLRNRFSGRKAVKISPEDYPDRARHRARHLNDLGVLLSNRFSRIGAMADLEEAIQVEREAVNITPDHLNRARSLNNLGTLLGERFLRIGAIADLEEAIQIERGVVNTTENHPDRVIWLNNLGVLLSNRFSRTGIIADLEEAIQVGREVVDITSKVHPDWARRLNNLGVRLSNRFFGLKVVNITPEDHPDQARRLNNLGVLLGNRFSRIGAMADLEEAIRVGQEAVDITPRDYSDRASRLNNLGTLLGDRFKRIGAIADLEEAIQVGRESVNTTPADHPDRVRWLNNLGVRLGNRFVRTGAMADLEEAIQVGREVINTTPGDHPDRARALNNLGVLLSDRFSRIGTMADLQEGIQAKREAVNSAPKNHPDRATWLNNLGNTLGDRFLKIGAIADLEEAIQIGREVVNTTLEDHPDRANRLRNLGTLLDDRFLRTGAMADLEEAISYYQTALRQSNSSTLTRISAGKGVLRSCIINSDWQQAYEASEIIIPLVAKLPSRSLENSDKQHRLSQVVGLASDAAAAALHVGKRPLIALDFLEQGRGVLATSLEEMRTDILELREKQPKLAEQFSRLQDELGLPVMRKMSFIDNNRDSSQKPQANRRYEAGKELDKLIVDIRQQPRFKDFLLAPSKRELKAAARCGPIVVLNVSEYRCDAILVEPHQIRSLALPRLNNKEIEDRAQTGSLESPEVLEWLWDNVARPIIDALGFLQAPSNDNWPHIWWIATGALSKFPIHAAGRHSKDSSESVLDRVMSTYSSSVKAIIHGRQSSVISSTSIQALLVAMEHTPGNSRLPFATEEVAMVRGICKSMAFDPIEPGRRKQDVISHLPHCRIFHFAGHGHTDDEDPSKSHLLLEDGKNDPLTVATLLDMNLRKHSPFLAYLSACGTGRIKDERFFDESIHLISACQLAGFRHVIGTLWEVDDDVCVEMARITYEGIKDGMKDGQITDDSVCRGLHKATRELRNRWLDVSEGARNTSKTVQEAQVEHEGDTTGVRDGYERDARMPWKISQSTSVDLMHWVPYVHFGV